MFFKSYKLLYTSIEHKTSEDKIMNEEAEYTGEIEEPIIWPEPCSGAVLHLSVVKGSNNVHMTSCHGYTYVPAPEKLKSHKTAMARHTYTTTGYMEKNNYKGFILDPTVIDMTFIVDGFDIKAIGRNIIDKLPTDCSNIHIIANVRLGESGEELSEGFECPISLITVESCEGLSIANTLNSINIEGMKTRAFEPSVLFYKATEYFKEVRVVPDVITDNKLILQREIPKGYIYTVNAKKYSDVGRTLNDTTYTVIRSDDPEIINDKILEPYKNKILKKAANVLILDARSIYQPRIAKAVLRHGEDSIVKINDDVLFNTPGDIKVVLGRHVNKINLTIRGLTILDTIKDRLDKYISGEDVDRYVDFTEQLDKLTNQNKFLRVKTGGVSYKLLVGVDVPSYNHFRRLIKDGATFHIGMLDNNGLLIYVILIKHEKWIRLSSNYFCETSYLDL